MCSGNEATPSHPRPPHSASRVPCQAVSLSGQKVPSKVPNLSLPNFWDSVLLGLEATSQNWPEELHATPDSPSSPPGPQAAPGHLFWSLQPLGAPACLPAHPTLALGNPPRASPAGAGPQPSQRSRNSGLVLPANTGREHPQRCGSWDTLPPRMEALAAVCDTVTVCPPPVGVRAHGRLCWAPCGHSGSLLVCGPESCEHFSFHPKAGRGQCLQLQQMVPGVTRPAPAVPQTSVPLAAEVLKPQRGRPSTALQNWSSAF